jgi:hypothetical protein
MPEEAAMSEDGFDLPNWVWPDSAGARRAYALQCGLEQRLKGVPSVFLDVNFWIDCRDAFFDPASDIEKRELYALLLDAVRAGRLFCPMSSDVLSELTKQRDAEFGATMAVVDELTEGVAMVPHRERLVIEVERFLGGFSSALAAPHRPIWTSFVYAFGYTDILPPVPFRRTQSDLLAMVETGWRMPPSTHIPALRRAIKDAKAESERAAARLNRGADDHRAEVTSYAKVLSDELDGAADLISGHLMSEYDRMASEVGAPAGDETLRRNLTRMAALGMKNTEGQKAFGNIVVPATLHAAFRAEKNRRFTANDIFDFRHAAAALPNCQAFFTEGKLARLLASGHVALTTAYPCRVASTPTEAIAALRSLGVVSP